MQSNPVRSAALPLLCLLLHTPTASPLAASPLAASPLASGRASQAKAPAGHTQAAYTQAGHTQAARSPEKSAMLEANGSFDVKMKPGTDTPDSTISSYTLDKTFTGDLEGTSHGEMLSSGDPKSGFAGYVAMERVTAKLAAKTGSSEPARQGTFALMHTATMSKGSELEMAVTIVPGSGTGELSGIYGTLTITIAASGKHTYTLRYAFAGK